MARNEEKQLARLNRYYLEKQKQEELKKRPPRPRLDTLNTSRDLRKWLPTITRDIEFYVKQMEVTCYTDSKIEEFTNRIERLRQEYRAYLHKLRKLEPDVSLNSWSDRPYANRKRPADSITQDSGGAEHGSEEPKEKTQACSGTVGKFMPIAAPVLDNMPTVAEMYGSEKPAPIVWNANPETEDQPLQFRPQNTLAICNHSSSEDQPFQKSSLESAAVCHHTCPPSSSNRVNNCSTAAGLQSPQLSERGAHSCRNCCDRLTGPGVTASTASSDCEDKRENAVSPCSGKDKLRNNCQDETKAAASESKVPVPMLNSEHCDGHVISVMTTGEECGSVKGQPSNLLKLDYSDSSDDNL